jgi:hypothetical protein
MLRHHSEADGLPEAHVQALTLQMLQTINHGRHCLEQQLLHWYHLNPSNKKQHLLESAVISAIHWITQEGQNLRGNVLQYDYTNVMSVTDFQFSNNIP